MPTFEFLSTVRSIIEAKNVDTGFARIGIELFACALGKTDHRLVRKTLVQGSDDRGDVEAACEPVARVRPVGEDAADADLPVAQEVVVSDLDAAERCEGQADEGEERTEIGEEQIAGDDRRRRREPSEIRQDRPPPAESAQIAT